MILNKYQKSEYFVSFIYYQFKLIILHKFDCFLLTSATYHGKVKTSCNQFIDNGPN